MSRFAAIDLNAFPLSDVLDPYSHDVILADIKADFSARWDTLAGTSGLPSFDTLMLESEPVVVLMQAFAAREILLRARINDKARSLTLAGALDRPLDHIGAPYYRTLRRPGEDDETFRQRLAIAPESWSTAGPVGAYVFWAMSASADVQDVAVYSEDEGVCKAPHVHVVLYAKPGTDAPAREAMRLAVQTALRRADIRPLTDQVSCWLATDYPYTLAITLRLRSGVMVDSVIEQARSRVVSYCLGRLRYAGENANGPVWLIGRSFSVESLAGVAMGGDPNILEADVVGGDVNAPHPGYTHDALGLVGTDGFEPLAPEITAHLYRAPILTALTITPVISPTGWIG